MKCKPTPLRLTLAALFLCCLTLGAYLWRFYQPGTSQDITDWAQFGDFMSGTLGPIIGIVNVFLVSYIAITIGQQKDVLEKRLSLFQRLQEWNSLQMMGARQAAYDILKNDPKRTLAERSETKVPDATPLWTVLHFFMNLSLASDPLDILDSDEAARAFGQIFAWWDGAAINGDYPPKWDDEKHWNRFRESVKRLHGEKTYEKWRLLGKNDLTDPSQENPIHQQSNPRTKTTNGVTYHQ